MGIWVVWYIPDLLMRTVSFLFNLSQRAKPYSVGMYSPLGNQFFI